MRSRFAPLAVSAFALVTCAPVLLAAPDPCALLTPADAAAAAGGEFAAGVPSKSSPAMKGAPASRTPPPVSCVFTNQNQETVTIELRTLNRPMTAESFAEENRRYQSILGGQGQAENIEGIGDFGYVSFLDPRNGIEIYRSAITVFRGKQQVLVSVARRGEHVTSEQLKGVATAALGRLPKE